MTIERPVPGSFRRPRLIAAFAALGIVASIGLHLYFVWSWSYYLRSIPPDQVAQTAGRTPEPFFYETTLSLKHGMVSLVVLGALFSWLFVRQYRFAGWAFGSGVGLGYVALFFHYSGFGNLWPLSLSVVFLLAAGPTLAGASVVSFVRSRLQKQGAVS